jgi:hypothetical protein
VERFSHGPESTDASGGPARGGELARDLKRLFFEPRRFA